VPERPMTDAELEALLRDVGGRLRYPATPDLAQRVRARIETGPRLRGTWLDALRGVRLAPIAVTLVVILAAAAALSPQVRAGAAEFLRLRGIDLFPVPAVATPTVSPASAVATPTATPRLALGSRITLAQALGTTEFRVRVPTDPLLGEPDEVYRATGPTGTQIAFVYVDRSGIPRSAVGVAALVHQFRGAVDASFLGKGIGPGTRVEELTVEGARGVWIEGEAHLFFYRDAGGNVHQETLRLARNVLLWERDGVLLRIEAQLTKSEALRVAGTTR